MAYKAFQIAFQLLSSIAGDTHLKYLDKKKFYQQIFSNIKPSRRSKLNIFTFSALLFMSKAGSMFETKWRGLFSREENENPNWGQNPIIITVLELRNSCVSVQALFFLWILCTKALMTIYVIDKLHPTHFDYSFPFLFWNDCPSTFTWVN